MNRASPAVPGVRSPAVGLVAAVLVVVAPSPAAAQSTSAPVAPRSQAAEFYVQAYVNGNDKELIIRIDQEPDGLYIDAVSANNIAVPEPGALSFFAISSTMLLRRRRIR